MLRKESVNGTLMAAELEGGCSGFWMQCRGLELCTGLWWGACRSELGLSSRMTTGTLFLS